MEISIIIPAFNESEGVPQTAESLRNVLNYLRKTHNVEVIFVNDGSADNTASLLQEAFSSDPQIKVVSHEVNRGLGAALRTGFTHATGDIIITTDFDGTYSFTTIPQLLGRIIIDGVDIVTASPYHPNGTVEGVPQYRLLFSFGASLLYRLLVKWNVHTWTALFRAYRRRVIEDITIENDGFLSQTEMLVKALQAGYTVSEFPTTLRVRTFGQSSLKIARVTKAHLRYQARLLRAAVTRQPAARGRLAKRHS